MRNEDGSETFVFARWSWDVVRALEVTRGRVDMQLPPAAFTQMAGLLVRVDREYAWNADLDLSVPVVLAPMPAATSGLLLVDGWHRLVRAHMLRRLSLPASVLTEEESLSVRTDADAARARAPRVRPFAVAGR